MSRRRKRAPGGVPNPATPAAPVARGRRPRWPFALLALAAVAAVAAAVWRAPGPGSGAVERPHVLLITIDTLRADRLGAYGDKEAATPHLDALAAAGARFESATAQAPLTTPSHASILTGLNPPRHGVRDNGQALGPAARTLAEAFKHEGYATAAFVSGFPLDRRFGLARGFDEYDDRLPHGDDARRAASVERGAEGTTASALGWLESRPAGQSWFAWIHYFDPHAPYEPRSPERERFAGRPYDGEVAVVDAEIGRLLGRLAERGDRGRTLVLVTADHGESLGEHGEETHGVFVYESTLRVPFLVTGPGVRPGLVPAVVARGVDVAPTLLDLAGARPLAGIDGRSLRPALQEAAMTEEPAYAEALFARLNLGWAPLHAWRRGRYKLVEAPRPELFDVADDPGETRDVAPSQPDVLRRMQGELRAALAAGTPAARGATGPDAETERRLSALGYLGGGSRGDEPAGSGRDPKDGIALVNRLERAIAETRTRPAWAAAELAAVLAADPSLALARRYRAVALASAGDAAAAVREIDALERSGRARADDLVLLAECLRLSGRTADALRALDRAQATGAAGPEAQLTRAQVLLGAGRPGEAAAAYERVLAERPTSAAALRGLGDLALARGDAAAAEAHYARVLQHEPHDLRARLKLGLVQARTGRLDAALASFQEVVARDPAHTEALLALAGALAKSGRAPAAVPYFERAVAAGARSPAALNGLGFARLEAGDARGALESLRASLALEPRQPDIARAVAEISRGGRP